MYSRARRQVLAQLSAIHGPLSRSVTSAVATVVYARMADNRSVPTLDDLFLMTDEEWLRIRGVGAYTVQELRTIDRERQALDSAPPRWALTLDDLDLPVRAYTTYKNMELSKAWHLAALCDRCLLRERNFGKESLRKTREQLVLRGFETPPRCQGGGRREGAWVSRCWKEFRICRALLEREGS